MKTNPACPKPIIFDVVGAHSTGKDTLINNIRDYFLEHHHHKIIHHSSVSRTELHSRKLKIYQEVDDLFQSYISLSNWASIFKAATRNPVVCCTDLVVRSLAYTLAGKKCSSGLEQTHKNMLDFVHNVVGKVYDIYWIYLPVEFPIVADGVRDKDENYRNDVDSSIQYIFRTCDIPHYIVRGSIKERRDKIVRFLSERIPNHPYNSCEIR